MRSLTSSNNTLSFAHLPLLSLPLFVCFDYEIAFTFVFNLVSVTLTAPGGGLDDQITISPECVLSAFAPVFFCGQALSDYNPVAQNAF